MVAAGITGAEVTSSSFPCHSNYSDEKMSQFSLKFHDIIVQVIKQLFFFLLWYYEFSH